MSKTVLAAGLCVASAAIALGFAMLALPDRSGLSPYATVPAHCALSQTKCVENSDGSITITVP